MTTDEINAPIDPPLNREQVMMPTGAGEARAIAGESGWILGE